MERPGRIDAQLIELIGECCRGVRGTPMMDCDISAIGMQTRRDRRANASRGARNKRDFAVQRCLRWHEEPFPSRSIRGAPTAICRKARYKDAILKDFERLMQHEMQMILPEPDAASAAHSACCAEYIHDRIRDAGGSISFAEYMHYALYAPGVGYYTAGATKFGADGDFVTAPEISPIFGRILARQCAAVLDDVEHGSILEFGAGSGKLAADLLRALDALDAFPDNYLIIEISADLRERQESYLRSEIGDLAKQVRWLDRLPDEHAGVVVANEVLDALPVERFVRRSGGIGQIRVAAEEHGFKLVEEPAPAILTVAVENIEDDLGKKLPQGFASEVSLAAPGWIADISGTMKHGVAFLFDYGLSRREYYAVDRAGGWLRCHFRHHAHSDPLILPGAQDLTAWVDFSGIATAAVSSGLEVAGYVTQAQFLLGGGLDEELKGLTEMPLEAQLELSGQVKMLTLPGEMGENIKCLGLSRGPVRRPAALVNADRTHAL